MAFDGKNIKFLQGSYDKLKTLTTSEVGAFYITNDTHEMFLGVEANKAPVALNRWVDVKDKFADITRNSDYEKHPGKIYYAKEENILCTWDGENWTQINPDTDTDTSISRFEISAGKTGEKDGKKVVEYEIFLTQKDINGDELNDKDGNPLKTSATLTITDELVTSLVVDVKVGLEASVASNVATIKTVGAGSDASKTVAFTGADGITIGEKDGQIVIDGTTYELSSDGAKVVLTDSDKETDTVEFIGDDKWIATGAGADGQIKISHTGPDADSAAAIDTYAGTAAAIDVKDRKFSALTAVKADENGHVVGAELTEFTIPNTVYTLEGEYGKVENVDYSTIVKLVDGDNSEDKVEIKTAHVITIDNEKKVIANGGDFGSFYSAAEIDRQFRVLDALTYKGTVADEDGLPTEAGLGDTYKVSAAFGNYEVGDLLIANGEREDENGKIVGTITWDHISTGTDADTTYTFVGSENKLTLIDSVEGEKQSVTVSGDDYINTTVSGNEMKIAHKTVERKDTEGADITPAPAASFDVVTGVSSNAAGHITGIETTTVTLPGADVVEVTDNGKMSIEDPDGGIKGSITIEAGAKLDANSVITDGKNLTVTVSHEEIATTTAADATKNVSVALTGTGNTFEVVDSVISDGYGHITDVKTKTITVAKETTYTLSDSTIANNIATQELKNNSGEVVGAVALASDTLTYHKKENDTKTYIDLTWGSF